MVAYEKYVTIDDSQEVVLSNLPVQAGQRVRVMLLMEGTDRSKLPEEFLTLLKSTQALPQAKEPTEEEIAAEVAAHRSSKS